MCATNFKNMFMLFLTEIFASLKGMSIYTLFVIKDRKYTKLKDTAYSGGYAKWYCYFAR